MKFRLKKNLVFHRKGQTAFILSLDDPKYAFKLDALAATSLQLIEKEPLSANEIFDQLKLKVPTKFHTQLKEDVDKLLEKSLKMDIIE